MKRYSILLSGPTIGEDKLLIDLFAGNAQVFSNRDNNKIYSILACNMVDMVILEILDEKPNEVEIIKLVKAEFQEIEFILINSNRKLIARAISYGAKDVFKKPYKRNLMVERVDALLGGSNL